MNLSFLFPNRYKTIGWIVFIPTAIFGVIVLIYDYEPPFLNMNLPAIFVDDFTNSVGIKIFGTVRNNILNEILGILGIISGLMVAFAREKLEDEYINKIRLESLVWAVYTNYGVLILSFLFVYDLSFFWVMVFNMFTVLLFFIIRFNWQLSRIK